MARDALIDSFDFSKYGNAEFFSLWIHQVEKGVSDSLRFGFKVDPKSREGKMSNPYATYLNRCLAIIQHLPADYQEDLRYFVAWRSHWQDLMSIDLARYTCALQRMYRTKNLEYIRYFVSEERFEMYKREFAMLEKYGLHKEIDFQFFDDNPNEPDTLRTDDGKNKTFSPAQYGMFKEIYYNQNNQVVYENIVDFASIRLYMYRTKFIDLIRETKADSCFNCGAEIEHEFEAYHCPHCYTAYDGEAAVWIVTELWVEEEKKQRNMQPVKNKRERRKPKLFSKLTKGLSSFLNGFVIPVLILAGIIMAFVDFEPFFKEHNMDTPAFFLPPLKYIPIGIVFLPLALGLVAVILSGIYMLLFQKFNKNYKFSEEGAKILGVSLDLEKKILEADDNFSINSLRRHLDALGVSKSIWSKYLQEGEEVLSSSAPLIALKKRNSSEKPAGRKAEILELDYKVPVLIVSGVGRTLNFREVDIDEKLTLIRDAGIKTPLYTKPSQFTCSSCGSHSKLQRGEWQFCNFCGNKLELRTIDWQLI